MKVLLAPTESFIKRETSQVAENANAGSSVVVTLKNSLNFAVNDYVAIGTEGSESAELAKITAVSGQTVTLDLLKLPHYADEPIVKYRYNKRKFYGCATINGTYVDLASYGSPVTINVGDNLGTLLEYTGTEGYVYFKATYYNSTTTEETSTSDADPVYADDSLRYCSIYAIKKQAGLTNNPYITDGIIETYRKRAESEVDSYLNSHYTLPLVNSDGDNEVPFLIENCTTLLAAGYMDYQEFGKDGQGVKWLGEARSILKKLQNGGSIQLLGSNKQEMQEKELSSGVHSYPNEVNNTDGPIQMFTTRQKF
jgi:phage gp36-like protein